MFCSVTIAGVFQSIGYGPLAAAITLLRVGAAGNQQRPGCAASRQPCPGSALTDWPASQKTESTPWAISSSVARSARAAMVIEGLQAAAVPGTRAPSST